MAQNVVGLCLPLLAFFFLPLAMPGLEAQNPATRSGAHAEIPRSCLEHETSERITELLETLRTRPTAGGYNTLGALYAEQKTLRCAIPSFEAALRLDSGYWQARYNLALALTQQGNSRRAEAELRAVIRREPDAVNAHNALGMLLQSSERWDEAAEQFKAALHVDPRFAFAAMNLAQVLSAQRRYSAAIFYLKKALEAGPPQGSVEPLRLALGMAYAQDGNFKDAIATIESVVRSHSDSAEAHFNLATVYAKQGLRVGYEAAVEEFRKSLEINPDDNLARISLAKALLSLQRYGEALPYLKEYTRRKPGDYEGSYVLGTAYRELGQFDEAKEALRRAARLRPDNYDVRYDLGVVLAHGGELEKGIEQLEAAEQINPHAPEAHYQLGLLLEKTNQKMRAQKELKTFQALKERSTEETTAGNLNNQANTLLAENKIQEAVETYRKAVRLNPGNAQWHYNLSLALEKLGDRRGQEQELEKTLELDPNLAVAHNQLGLLYLEKARVVEAEREFKTALDINPKYAEAQDNLGVLYNQKGKDPEALKLFQQAVENDPRFTKAFVNLGLTFARLGNLADAEKQFQRALQVDPNDDGALTSLGMLEAKTGHGDQAIGLFQKVLALHPGSADAHVNLGIALADQFDLESARKEFSAAIELKPDSPVAHYNQGRVLYDLGRREEARAELETAIQLAPNYTPALFLLAVTEGLSPRALQLLQKVVLLDPHNAQAQYLLGQNFHHLDRTEEAIRHWKLAVDADPSNYSALYNLARALSKAGDPDAKRYMDRFAAVQKARQITDRVHQLNNFALDAANAHNWSLAVTQLKEALEACGQCSERAALHRNLGLIYARRGDLEGGEHELQMAIEISPDDPDALKAIKILRSLQKKPSDSN